MKTLFLILHFTACFCFCYSQEGDLSQPPFVYKENKVRARIMFYLHSRYNTKVVDLFDKDGWNVERVYYDTSGTKVETRMKRVHDSMGHVTREVVYEYRHFDSATRKYVLEATPEVTETKITYDTVNKRRTRVRFNKAGKKVLEGVYDYRALTDTYTYYGDTLTHRMRVVFENPWIEKELTEIDSISNGVTDSAQVTFSNSFDKTGRITGRKTKVILYREGKKIPLKQTSTYLYSGTGLLTQKYTEGETKDKFEWQRSEVFDYKFW